MTYKEIRLLPCSKEKGIKVYETKWGPIKVSDDSAVEDGAELLGGAEIYRSAVDSKSVVAGTIKGSALKNSWVGIDSKLTGSIFESARCGNYCLIEKSRLEPGAVIGDRAIASRLVMESMSVVGDDLIALGNNRIRVRAWCKNGLILLVGAEVGIKMICHDHVTICAGIVWSDSELFENEVLLSTGSIMKRPIFKELKERGVI